MTASTVLHHALLVVATGCQLACGTRIADRAGVRGLERLLAAIVIAAALVVLETLALGAFGLSDSTGALVLLAAAGLAAARRWLPAPRRSPGAELAAWWEGAGGPARAAAGAAVAGAAVWIAWQLRHPHVGVDGILYHLPIAAGWAQGGHAGSIVDVAAGIPFGNYPVTNEVLVAWGLAVAHSWVVASIWTPLTLALAALAGVVGLRALAVPPAVRALTVAAYCALPLAVVQTGGPLTDLPAAAWILAAAALVAAAPRAPGLVPVALVAAGLSIGTKTTGAVLLVVLAGIALLRVPAARRLQRPWAVAVPVALACGGIWMARNLAAHGSPLWPLASGPWGDPIPPAFAAVDASFLDHPRAMLDGRVGDYLRALAGGTGLLFGGIVAGLATRRRAAVVAAGATLVALLAWMNAPYTGIAQSTSLAVGATRYLLPGMAAGGVALALAARDGGPRLRGGVTLLLAAALGVSLWQSWDQRPFSPPLGAVALGALAGAALGALAGVLGLRRALPRRALALAAGGALAVGLAAGAAGYLHRHADAGLADAGLMRFASADRAFGDGDFPIVMGPGMDGLVAGDRLQHRLALADDRTPCPRLQAAASAGWVVLQGVSDPVGRRLAACLAGTAPIYADAIYRVYARAP